MVRPILSTSCICFSALFRVFCPASLLSKFPTKSDTTGNRVSSITTAGNRNYYADTRARQHFGIFGRRKPSRRVVTNARPGNDIYRRVDRNWTFSAFPTFPRLVIVARARTNGVVSNIQPKNRRNLLVVGPHVIYESANNQSTATVA